jgi:hypothetical protein
MWRGTFSVELFGVWFRDKIVIDPSRPGPNWSMSKKPFNVDHEASAHVDNHHEAQRGHSLGAILR